jgi:hydrogenase maturation protein HypF
MERTTIAVTGMVQGVGFRPFVYTLARALDLRGFVQNRGAHVFVDVEGDPTALEAFLDRLATSLPPRAAVERVASEPAMPVHYRDFEIATSEVAPDAEVRVPADVATCDSCLAELFDPHNRRYRHPFIACTTCGPRYSIVTTMPYDRANTTMAAFAMCRQCRDEYANPRDRRFHAQAIACPECGPVLSARSVEDAAPRVSGDAALRAAAGILTSGGIVVIKGLGGFHLACDATSAAAVARLRRRKGREQKPLAVMCGAVEGQRIGVAAGARALAALTSYERPIVLVAADLVQKGGSAAIASNVAPGCSALGVFLPYTPLHHLLLFESGRPLVMTSANVSDEPMVIDDDVALDRLAGMADLILTHDRRIHARVDDSVVRVSHNVAAPVRRARGYAPMALRLAEKSPIDLLATGGHLKNTCCFVRRDLAYLSPHVGTLESAAAYASLQQTISELAALLRIEADVIAHDLHPDYLSTRLAHALPATRRIAVQHHHAHVLSCAAEHQCSEPLIGVVFDGTGLGNDGAAWGGEFLVVDGVRCDRLAHLAYVPMPGGDAATREPWRMAAAHLHAAFGADWGPLGDALVSRVTTSRATVLRRMIDRDIACVPTSSMGRLFDAVAALLGLRDVVAYEGQAAMELEGLASPRASGRYEFDIDVSSQPWRIESAPVIRAIARDIAAGRAASEIAAGFHAAVADMIAAVSRRIAEETGIRRVALTGGVFQNARLSRVAARALRTARLDVLEHRVVPCNDGGLALGQALMAVRTLRSEAAGKDVCACA